MRLNLEWFRTFKASIEAGTLTGAAQALYISQPGVSLHLNSLETYKGAAKNIEYQAFSKERIVLVYGGKTNSDPFEEFLRDNELEKMET